MAKMSFEQKRERVRQIEEQIEELEKELRSLFEPVKQDEKVAALPPGFSITEKVFEAIKTKPESISKGEVGAYLNEKYKVVLNPGQIQSSISYLINQGKIEIVGRAVYKLKQ